MQLLGLNLVDSREIVRDNAERLGLIWPQILGTDEDAIVSDYRLSGTPLYVLVAADGRISAQPRGIVDLERAIEGLLAPEAPSDVSLISEPRP